MKKRRMLAVGIAVVVMLFFVVGGGILYKNGDLFQGRLTSGITADCSTLQKQCRKGNIEACYEVKEVCAPTTSPSTSTTTEITPVGPSNLVLTPSGDKIYLRWTDNSDNERGFKVKRSFRSTGPYEDIKTLTLNVNTFWDDTVVRGYTYYYRVYSVYGPRLSDTYAEGSAAILLGAPYNLRADAVSSGSVALSWEIPSYTGTVYTYEIEIVDVSTGTKRLVTVPGTTPSATELASLSSDTTYTFRVKAYVVFGAESPVLTSYYSVPLTVTTLSSSSTSL